jgi:hypothetical protein
LHGLYANCPYSSLPHTLGCGTFPSPSLFLSTHASVPAGPSRPLLTCHALQVTRFPNCFHGTVSYTQCAMWNFCLLIYWFLSVSRGNLPDLPKRDCIPQCQQENECTGLWHTWHLALVHVALLSLPHHGLVLFLVSFYNSGSFCSNLPTSLLLA